MIENKDYLRIKPKSLLEADAREFVEKPKFMGGLLGLSWFLSLSKAFDQVTKYFKSHTPMLFGVGILINSFRLMVMGIEQEQATNTNRGKIAELAYAAFLLLCSVTVALIFIYVSPVICGYVLVATMYIDPLVNMARALFYSYMSNQAGSRDKETRAFFNEKAKWAAMYGAAGFFVTSAFVVLMLVTLPLSASITIAALGASMIAIPLLRPYAVKFYEWVKNILTGANESMPPQQKKSTTMHYRRILGLSDDEPVVHPTVWKEDYYGNSIVRKEDLAALSLADVREQVRGLIGVIGGQIKEGKSDFIEQHVWSQAAKRAQKVSALNFLDRLIGGLLDKSLPQDNASGNTVQLAGVVFNYKDREDLVVKINNYVLTKWPLAYESKGYDIGKTQACFNFVGGHIINPEIADEELAVRLR